MATNAELRLRFFRYFLEALTRRLADRVGAGRVPAGAWRRDRIPGTVVGERDDLFHVRDRAHNRLWGPRRQARCLSDHCTRSPSPAYC
jgi:hypothetical protein